MASVSRSSLFEANNPKLIQFGSRPNMKNYQVNSITPLISSAKSALIVVPQLGVDGIAAGLALGLALKSAGKQVKVYCPQKTDNNYSKLSGLELLTDGLITSDLTVSLEYPLDQIEQVSYNDDGGRLNLVVKTKPNSPHIDDQKILINNNSDPADVCIMLGDEAALGQNSSVVGKGNWVFISPVNVPKAWAKATLVDPDAPFSEIFTFLIPMVGLSLDPDSGKNLLIGLRVATQSFSVNVSPETFDAGAICLSATQTAAPVPAPAAPVQPNPITNSAPIESVEVGRTVPTPSASTPAPAPLPTN